MSNKKKVTINHVLNMTQEFGVTSNTKATRIQQFSYIGDAIILMQLDKQKRPRPRDTTFDDLNRDQLRKCVKIRNITINGSKAELIARLREKPTTLISDTKNIKNLINEDSDSIPELEEFESLFESDDDEFEYVPSNQAKQAQNSHWIIPNTRSGIHRARRGL